MANSPRTVPLVQPQSEPLETASSRETRAVDRPMAPIRSKRPPARTFDSGTMARTSAKATAPRAAEVQNRMCQSKRSAMKAAEGRPRAPPTPSEALIRAVELVSRSAGSTSRMTLMPSGTTAAARPCRVRPTIIGTRESLSAQTTEPATSRTMLTRSMRRLPNMSPRRPTTGVATEAASSVAVTAQMVFDAEASRSFGSSGTIGMTRVCISETTIPARASTATTAFDFAGAEPPTSADRARASGMAEPPVGGAGLLDSLNHKWVD